LQCDCVTRVYDSIGFNSNFFDSIVRYSGYVNAV